MSSTHSLAVERQYKDLTRGIHTEHLDEIVQQMHYHVGEQVLVRFFQTNSTNSPSFGNGPPYKIVSYRDNDVNVIKVYHPEEGQIQVHQSCVSPCPSGFPPGLLIWEQTVGKAPKCIQNLIQKSLKEVSQETSTEPTNATNSGLNGFDDSDFKDSNEDSDSEHINPGPVPRGESQEAKEAEQEPTHTIQILSDQCNNILSVQELRNQIVLLHLGQASFCKGVM